MNVSRSCAPRFWLSVLVLFALLFGSARAHAQDGEAARQEARATFERGVAASRAAHWDEARSQFERSLALVPKPSTMFNLAIAYIKLGLGREALAQLDAFESAAQPEEHAAMLERAQVLRPQAQALVDSAQAKARSGGNVLSHNEDGLSDDARAEVQKARDSYAKGRDVEALQGFERAYRLSKRPELLYNIGVVADRLRDDERAIRAYDAFVEALPDAREAAVAQVRSEALRVGLERERNEPRPENGSEAERPSAPPVNLRAPRALVVTGTVISVASLATMAALFHKLSDYHKCLDSTRDKAASHVCDNAHDVRNDKPKVVGGIAAAGALAGVGVVLISVGATQLFRRKHASDLALVPSFSVGEATSGTLTLSGRF